MSRFRMVLRFTARVGGIAVTAGLTAVLASWDILFAAGVFGLWPDEADRPLVSLDSGLLLLLPLALASWPSKTLRPFVASVIAWVGFVGAVILVRLPYVQPSEPGAVASAIDALATAAFLTVSIYCLDAIRRRRRTQAFVLGVVVAVGSAIYTFVRHWSGEAVFWALTATVCMVIMIGIKVVGPALGRKDRVGGS